MRLRPVVVRAAVLSFLAPLALSLLPAARPPDGKIAMMPSGELLRLQLPPAIGRAPTFWSGPACP